MLPKLMELQAVELYLNGCWWTDPALWMGCSARFKSMVAKFSMVLMALQSVPRQSVLVRQQSVHVRWWGSMG